MKRPDPETAALLLPFAFSILFVAIPLAMTMAGVRLVWIGWLSIAFGAVGIVAVGAQLLGYRPKQRTGRSRSGKSRAPEKSVHHKGPPPELSANKQAQVRRAVKVMAQAGVFAPTPPDPALLYAGATEMDWSIQPDVILLALLEAEYYHSGFDPAPHLGNLVLHDIQVETPAEVIEAMIRDLERLSAGALVIADLQVTQEITDPDARTVRTGATMTINGAPLTFTEEHHFKYFPTGLHPAIAGHMPPDRRFAALWVDQGAFVTVLAPGAVEAMNAALKLTPNSRCHWDWIVDAPSTA
ncbi:MAG: hypothetical protein B7Y97_06630 [Sphingomonas sp. 32-66-10]|nr:MAG: hypothetical protein B7Y97_06630 [Sphingomonas sp. 32-66-10]